MPAMAKKKNRKSKSKPLTAATADKYTLYQHSVQEPEHEVEFFDQAYREVYGKRPMILREDFCGTFAICCEWVKSHAKRTAIGVDLDPEPLAWGREHNLARVPVDAQNRVILKQADVRQIARTKADVLAAQNFSFWYFKTRMELLAYFKKAYRNLAEQGIMVMDMMGGGECYEEMEDVRKIEPDNGTEKFKYVWEQAAYNPITHDGSFYIHFRFKDGTEMTRAFEYHWRFWTIPEVRELLADAGFRESHVYWEGEDEDGDGNDEWTRVADANPDPSWIAYIVAFK